MKVLSFSYCYPHQAAPAWGVFVHQRLAALGKHVELQVVSPAPWFPIVSRMRKGSGPAKDSWCGLTVHRPKFLCIPKVLKSLDGRLYAWSLQNWLAGLNESWPPDLLDAHFIWPDGVGVSRLAQRMGLPYAVTLRGWLYEAMGRPRIRRQCIQALRGAAVVISVDAGMAELARESGVPENRIHLIPNGVDLARFQPGDRLPTRRQLGLPMNGRLLVTVAHLGSRKGHFETIAALKDLPDDVYLVLVGGPGPHGGDGEDLRQLACTLGLEHRLILAGKQPYERIPEFYHAADVSVLASWREGCPNVVLESLACGTPVVATDVGSVSTMIENGVNGRIVPVRSAEKLAQAIGEVLTNPPPPEQVRQSAAVRSWDDVAETILTTLQTAVSCPTGDGCSIGTASTADKKLPVRWTS